jgi:hypothetical protein
MDTMVTVPLDEILRAVRPIVDDRGEGSREPQMPAMLAIWAANHDRADALTNEPSIE